MMGVQRFILWVLLLKWTQFATAGPLGVLSEADSNSLAEDDPEEDFTTHGLDRLSSAATCLVAGVEYTHGQQIYRKDRCEFCLCLDGEMFCWWQDCPPTMEGPCRERSPFSACLNSSPSESSSASSRGTTHSPPVSSSIIQETTESENTTDGIYLSETISEETIMPTTEIPSTTTNQIAKFCLIMGRKYEIGDKLPHDTGNCVECVCGQGGQVSCSPHLCAPAGEDINDYRPPGPRQPAADVF